MFAIDLLKGEAVPIKSRPEGIAITAATLAVPVIVAISLLGLYLSNAAAISIQKQQVDQYRKKTEKFSQAVAKTKSFKNQESAINGVLSEVATSINHHIQWSPIIVALVKSIPDSLMLTALEVKQHNVTKKIPQKNNPETLVDTKVNETILRIQISGNSSRGSDIAVRGFKDRLRSSPLLGPKLEDIRLISRQDADEHRSQDVISYEIYCIFKQ